MVFATWLCVEVKVIFIVSTCTLRQPLHLCQVSGNSGKLNVLLIRHHLAVHTSGCFMTSC